MEIIEPSGLRLTFTDNGVVPDFVPFSECCEICNDPRMINENGVLKCVVCHGINLKSELVIKKSCDATKSIVADIT